MEIKKLVAAMAVASSAVLLSACAGDEDVDVIIVETGSSSAPATPDNPTVPSGQTCGTVGVTTGQTISVGDTTLPQCALSGRITQDAQLTSNFVYTLQGFVTVGDGNETLAAAGDASRVILTVDAGVQFRSSTRGALVISRGSEILMNGTADNPIVMSSLDNDFSGSGEWAGLVLQGFSSNNQCPAAPAVCNIPDEAGTGFHGGAQRGDSSGKISHVIVAEGGFEVAEDEEINGVTFHSVGHGTEVDNLMVYGNADDGVEFFGGTVNVSNLILVDNGDESIDWDHGYQGNIQFALVRQGVNITDAGDYAIEADNDGGAFGGTPVSNPTLANVTFQEITQAESDELFRLKEGTGGRFVNVAAANYLGDRSTPADASTAECVRIDDNGVGAQTGAPIVLTNFFLGCGVAGQPIQLDDNGAAAATAGVFTAVNAETVTLDAAFAVAAPSPVVSAVDLNAVSANEVTDFFTDTTYVGAVAPNTAADDAFYAWAAKVIPAAFQ
ncbi:hypothetical protein [Bacterioplanoides sp.]|uniref:hypothetical protein n=1 Tax=Bacterioplanoides sp. TaxID=2066072 RepID=UPI003AFF890C